MTAVPKILGHAEVAAWDIAVSRPTSQVGKADAQEEETGKCTPAAAGIRVPASKERLAEITSGTATTQQGLAATCKDPLTEG